MGTNVVAYTLGLGYICGTRFKVFRTLARLARGDKVEPPPSAKEVRSSLTMGEATAVVSAILWTVSGFIIPAWMQYGAGLDQCLVARRLSGVHRLEPTVRNDRRHAKLLRRDVLLRPLLRSVAAESAVGRDARSDGSGRASPRRGRFILWLTFSVPFLALLALLGLSAMQLIDLDDRGVLASLGGLGLIGCGLAYYLDFSIRADLAALAGTMNPSGDAPSSGRHGRQLSHGFAPLRRGWAGPDENGRLTACDERLRLRRSV